MKLREDVPASIAVFLVALPLCLGIALASEVPLMAGLIAGVIGGIVVGGISGSHTSVSGPAAGLVAIVLSQVETLGSFEAFLLAVVLSGVLQIALGVLRAGVIAYYFPSGVIVGLLAAIGLILILKQIPHAVGYDRDAEGDFRFFQPDGYNTFTELGHMFDSFSLTAVVISVTGLVLLRYWSRSRLGRGPIPGALIAVAVGVAINEAVKAFAPQYALLQEHCVQLNTNDGLPFGELFTTPRWSEWANPKIYVAALTIAVVASLETLLNLEAVDRIDAYKRTSPPNRELIAQGVGNMCSGLIGGLPVTSVIVRSSANVYSGSRTKASAILHGVWLGLSVFVIPGLLERIPLAALAAVLLFTGFKLANPSIFRVQFRKGLNQFLPFIVTVVAIVFTDLLIGIVIGLTVGVFFVLRSMEQTPFLSKQGNPIAGNVVRLKLGQFLTFWNRARMRKTLDRIVPGSHVVLDATKTEYIDPDILEMIREFRDTHAPAKNLKVSLMGFRKDYDLDDLKHYVDVVTADQQMALTPADSLKLLQEGNRRFRGGEMLERDWSHQRDQTVESQHPMAALVGCIDSRVPAELVFDVGIGDIFSVRVAGNVVNNDVLGSLEYATQVAGVKLIVVLGHTRCGAVGAACVNTQLGHVTGLIAKILPMVEKVAKEEPQLARDDPRFVDKVCRRNVQNVMAEIERQSELIRGLMAEEKVDIVGGVYDLKSGKVEFFGDLVDQLVMQPPV